MTRLKSKETHRQRRLLTTLQNNRIPSRQSRRNLHREHNHRKIPRDNQRRHTVGLFNSHIEHARRVGTRRALYVPAGIGKVSELLGRYLPIDVLRDRAAGAQRLQFCQFVVSFQQEIGHLAQVVAALLDA